MQIHRVRSYDEYVRHVARNKPVVDAHISMLRQLTPDSRVSFTVPGYSYTAGRQVDFQVDFQHSGPNCVINWRERVSCPHTYFNNRMRATFHLFDLEMEAYPDCRLYITEQITPIFKYFSAKFPNSVGSEFIGPSIPFGNVNKDGVRNEDLCALSFPDASFDRLVSLDVFEHIPDYQSAFRECARVLVEGGMMMWSVPFVPTSPTNLVRAQLQNGEVTHILPPEYHGDPLSDAGVLCFQHFGWEMLDQIREAGFRDAYTICYVSMEFGYLGGEQFMFVGRK